MGGQRAGGEKKAERGGEGGPHGRALWQTVKSSGMEGLGTTPPASALRLCFREVSDRAMVKMVCYARAMSLMWMILRAARRREAESLYDRARDGRYDDRRGAVVRLRSGVFARVGRVRVFRRPRGAYTRRASRKPPRESLATPPYGRLHTLALPPRLATQSVASCAPIRTSRTFTRTIEPHHASLRRSGTVSSSSDWRCAATMGRDPTACARGSSWGGSERSARRSPSA